MSSAPDADPLPSSRGRSALRRLASLPTPLVFGASIVVALVVLWFQGALRSMIEAMSGAEPGWLLVAAPIYVASLWLLCVRWHLLVRMAQGHSDLPRAAEAFLTSVVINYAAPIGLAVPSRAALTKRALGLDARATGTIALWEIGVDVLVLGAGTVLWLALAEGSLSEVRGELAGSWVPYAVAAVVVIVAIAGTVTWATRASSRRQRITTFGRRILTAPRERPKEALLTLAATTLYWIVQGIVIGMLVRSLGVATSFEVVLGLTSLPILAGMLSPIPGGAVVREALMYVVARLAGVSGQDVVAAAIVYRFALFAAIPILYLATRWVISRRRPPGDTALTQDPGEPAPFVRT